MARAGDPVTEQGASPAREDVMMDVQWPSPRMVTPGVRRLRLTCSVHGLLHEEEVYCGHEAEDITKRVQRSHGDSYGAGCTEGLLHVELLDPEWVDG